MTSTILAAAWLIYAMFLGLRPGVKDPMFHTAIICASIFAAKGM